MNSFHRIEHTPGSTVRALLSSVRFHRGPAAAALLLLVFPLAGCRHDALKAEIAGMESKYHPLVEQADQIIIETKRIQREMEPLRFEIDRKKQAARKDTAPATELSSVQMQLTELKKEVDALRSAVEAETKRLAEYNATHARP